MLCVKYNNRQRVDFVQQRALFRSYCHDTIKVFDDCFETTMLDMMRCKKKVMAYQSVDELDIKGATFDIVTLLSR